MVVEVEKAYHIKDEFFEIANDPFLMSNKEDGGYRPNFFCFADMHTEGIFWAIPISSKVEKYEIIMQRKIERFGKCDTIVISEFCGENKAFLIQNMFPIIEKYVDHEHTVAGVGVTIHSALVEELVEKATLVMILQREGKHLIFPDVDNIYNLMKQELEQNI